MNTSYDIILPYIRLSGWLHVPDRAVMHCCIVGGFKTSLHQAPAGLWTGTGTTLEQSIAAALDQWLAATKEMLDGTD